MKVLEDEIVPRLATDVPNQPSKKQLKKEPFVHRFCLVFDHEGYSPDFIKRMKEKRIACLTYHKYPKEIWPQEEFIPYQGYQIILIKPKFRKVKL